MRYEAVMARVSLGVCLARQGKFDEARQEFEVARTWAPKLTGDKHDEAGALLGLNEGWALGQLGEVRAMAVLEEGLAVATRSKDVLLTGRLLDGLAALHCDNKQVDEALSPALEAAKIAMRTGHPGLSRNANVTLALTYLLAGDLPNAAAAIYTAAQQPAGILALATQAIKGVIHFRMDDRPNAITAFHTACTEAWLRLERAPQEYAVYDAVGLALTGLELCGEAHRLRRALDMYDKARSIAPVKGARRRAKAQLALMEPSADKTKLEAAQRAADGDAAGARQLIA
jgi:tetratricopeptide (TPR) repeat protein